MRLLFGRIVCTLVEEKRWIGVLCSFFSFLKGSVSLPIITIEENTGISHVDIYSS